MALSRVNTSFKTQQPPLIQSSLLQSVIQSNKTHLNLLEQDFWLDPNILVLINIYQPPKKHFFHIWIHALYPEKLKMIFKKARCHYVKESKKKF